MSKLNTLHDLFLEELRDLYHAENQLLKALPEMELAAHNGELKLLIVAHRRLTGAHVQRLEAIFESLDVPAKGRTCKAMKGLIAEARSHLRQRSGPAVRDASIISSAQRIEHYEIAGYGTARAFADMLGYTEVSELLQKTLEEESAADHQLSFIAQGLNLVAMVNADDFGRSKASHFFSHDNHH
jgi:Uncharacterized protein conserved in bacteria